MRFNHPIIIKATAIVTGQKLEPNEILSKKFEVSGVDVGDYVMTAYSAILGNIIIASEVTSIDTVTVRFYNFSHEAVTLSTGELNIQVIKK